MSLVDVTSHLTLAATGSGGGKLSSQVWLSALALALALTWYGIAAVWAWYRLRQFPVASFSAGFSYLWLAKTTYSGRQYWVHRELNRRHGPIVRIGPNELMTDDPDTIKRICSARSKYARGDWYTTGRFNPYHDVMFTHLDPASHSKAKARLAPVYWGREVPPIEPAVDAQVKTLVHVLRSRYATPATAGPAPESPAKPLLDMGPLSCYFTLDVITRLGFGQEFGYLRDEADHYNFIGGLRDLWPRMSTCADIPWVRAILFSPVFLKLLGPKPTDKTGFGALMAVAEHHVGKRFEPGAEKQQDMLDALMRQGLDHNECKVEGLFMIISGTESTAGAIRSTLIHTMTSPKAYATLKAEIAQAVGDGRVSNPIQVDEARRLPYLQAVVYEGLRMRTPLLGLFPKVVPAGGDKILGKHVPAGTCICMNTSSLLRSPDLFGPDPDVFRPERFLVPDSDRRAEMERAVELAFGHGQHMCLGKNIAFMELFKAVFELLRNFDLQLASPAKPSDILSYGVFLEKNLLVKVSETDLGASAPAAKC